MPTDWFHRQTDDFNIAYKSYLQQIDAPQGLKEAMLYSSLNGGKRLRPLLVFASGNLCNAKIETLLPIAIAIESIHAYSLIHDDLPAMDNDVLRRGKPTCHIQFNESTAILAGDALLTDAFALLSSIQSLNSDNIIKLIALISKSAGSSGMVGGQFIDLVSENRAIAQEKLQKIHRMKTGAMIRASILAGAIAGNCSEPLLSILDQFSDKIGLAFQIKDDILDETQSSEVLGKTAGKDLIQEKATYTSILGLKEAANQMEKLVNEAIELILPFNKKDNHLIEIAKYILNRQH